MPARLRVLRGEATGTVFYFESTAARLGSGGGCELALPGEAAHAATVQFANGTYFVQHRAGEGVRLGGRPLPMKETRAWRAGERLRLPGGTSLVLQIRRDPAPSPHARSEFEQLERDAAKKTPKAAAAIAVTMLLLVSLLVPAGPAADRDDSQFSELYRALLEENTAYAHRLREARQHELRGESQYEEALAIYCRLRSEMLLQRETATLSATQRRALDYILDRIGNLAPRVSLPD